MISAPLAGSLRLERPARNIDRQSILLRLLRIDTEFHLEHGRLLPRRNIEMYGRQNTEKTIGIENNRLQTTTHKVWLGWAVR